VLSATPYSFKTRFENEKGTNPEELIAAAHAGCFTMALAFGLHGAGFAGVRPAAGGALPAPGANRLTAPFKTLSNIPYPSDQAPH
jgi:hypothetical protein